MTDYPEGTRLKVVFDVTVMRNGGWETDGGLHYIGGLMQRDAVSVERLPDPEPDWQPGDVVRAADGDIYARRRNDDSSYVWLWLDPAPGARVVCMDDEVLRPLTPLVRDGKPWGEQ